MGAKRLIVIGAGPKALALAAKAETLKRIDGISNIPDIYIVDKTGVAANWTGQSGFTNGEHALATSPMKDVGFPYHSECWTFANRAIDSAMLGFSWQSYLVETSQLNSDFADWLDRGAQPPSLAEWAEYLKWVKRKAGTFVHPGTATRMDIVNGKWMLEFNGGEPISADGLVITGPGPAKQPTIIGDHRDRVTNAENFWNNIYRIESDSRVTVGVIGDGGAAASIVLTLLRMMPEKKCYIKIISETGVVYSRGESYDEKRHYSNPKGWQHFSPENREKFIDHTLRGVFSVEAKSRINSATNIETTQGHVESIDAKEEQIKVRFTGGHVEQFDHVIVAIGFDGLWWKKKLGPNAQTLIGQRIDEALRPEGEDPNREINEKCVRRRMGRYLDIRNVRPRLHLPMLADEMQGPGFSNLGCLGLLSDRILRSYCTLDGRRVDL
ncbi:lysine N(6)-hydroxylase/L-ornithine N(5)-oxygenase family protein [Streptomyces sp. NBC_01551]|uniref:SidA/IucD/PvdA family monooxygenase n=1 Tax=Streptomyces sp. NBC_01551 TaxID=2975876 RepID=UPI00224D637E|nr:SidA/IucD/PvdA family monooxygenase [Streptomyces sp. NBC_01551]MCX4529302.1 lysine N(6)-hydroxylase/L-ornithine N(5)-oxygenase family protein [Streptomyces sp. NBC_01551]